MSDKVSHTSININIVGLGKPCNSSQICSGKPLINILYRISDVFGMFKLNKEFHIAQNKI